MRSRAAGAWWIGLRIMNIGKAASYGLRATCIGRKRGTWPPLGTTPRSKRSYGKTCIERDASPNVLKTGTRNPGGDERSAGTSAVRDVEGPVRRVRMRSSSKKLQI